MEDTSGYWVYMCTKFHQNIYCRFLDNLFYTCIQTHRQTDIYTLSFIYIDFVSLIQICCFKFLSMLHTQQWGLNHSLIQIYCFRSWISSRFNTALNYYSSRLLTKLEIAHGTKLGLTPSVFISHGHFFSENI